MRKLTQAAAGAAILLACSFASTAQAAPMSGIADLPLTSKYSTPLNQIACWCGPYRCACGRRWYRPYGYWGPRYWGPRRWRY